MTRAGSPHARSHTEAPSLSVDITMRRGAFHLAVALEVTAGEVVALVGPNGAGKSTLLRALAGLTAIEQGCVRLGERLLDAPAQGLRVSAEARDVGLVFQDHLLFPHLSAADNVAFGLRARGATRRDAHRQALTWLERMSLQDVADQRPANLSGGQAQRVALARALATDPAVLLLDEPLAALDIDTRVKVRRELRVHLDAFAGPCILVTHEPVDAIALADRLAVIEGGALVQTGAVSDVARRPRSTWAAKLVGLNLYRGHARDGQVRLNSGATIVSAAAEEGEVFAVVHPRAVALHTEHPSGSPRNVWHGSVTGLDAHRDHIRVHVDGPLPIVAEVTPAAAAELHLHDAGAQVWVAIKASEVDLYPA